MNAFDYFFEKTASLDKKFLVGKEEISFRELYEKSSDLSGFLIKNFGNNKNIMLLSPNNSFFLIAYLAILKSGNTCIPLDPMIDKDSFLYIRDLTSTSTFFVTDQVQMRLSIEEDKCIKPGSLPVKEYYDNANDLAHFDPSGCAEIIFTSGSTGTPKGVMISHQNLISNTGSIVEYLGLSENDRMMVVLPFYYCYGLSLLHTHLRVGGSVVLNNSFMFLGSVLNDMVNNKCTGFAGVPSHFQILLRKSDTFKSMHFPDLRYVTQAGGKLATVFIDEFRESFPNISFIVMYGQTEATARLAYLPSTLYEKRKGSVGKAIPGVVLRVVNESGEDVPAGETGEVIAKGDNIMLSYYKDEEGTEQTIRNGWLYTGDLGIRDEDGFIYLTARKKEIIKVGGKRISPKEIESVILTLPQVVDCSIEGIEDELLGEALKATVVVKNTDGNILTVEKIKQHCSENLTLYKIPQIIEIKDQMIMSATGKKIKNQA